MEHKERALSKQLFATQEDHKRDVTKLISHIENLIENNQDLVQANLRDREAHKADLEAAQRQHKEEVAELMNTLTVLQGMGVMSRSSSVSGGEGTEAGRGEEEDAGLDALRNAVMKMPSIQK